MSQSVGRIDLDVGLNYNQFRREMSGIRGMVQGITRNLFSGFTGIFAGVFAFRKLAQMRKEMTDLASDMVEVQNVVDVTFGHMSSTIDDFAKTTLDRFGISELAAKRYASTMGAMLKSSGLNENQVLSMSKGATGLAADLGSFYNIDPETMFSKIQSGLSGETEPLKRLGINMNVANLEAYALSQGIDKSWNSLSQAEQIIIRYNYLLNASKDAQGDFARTFDSWANQTRVFSEQIKELKGMFGYFIMQALYPLLKYVNDSIRSFLSLKDSIQGFVAGLSEVTWLTEFFGHLKHIILLLVDAFKFLAYVLGDTLASVGQLIMVGLVPLIKALNFLLSKILMVADAFRSFIKLVYGFDSVREPAQEYTESLYDAIDITGGFGDNVEDAGKKAKKAGKDVKGSIAAFDQLNLLMFPKGSGSGGDGALGDALNKLNDFDLGEVTSGEKDLNLKLNVEMDLPDFPPVIPLPLLKWPIPPLVFANEFKFALSDILNFFNLFAADFGNLLSSLPALLPYLRHAFSESLAHILQLLLELIYGVEEGLIRMMSLADMMSPVFVNLFNPVHAGFQALSNVLENFKINVKSFVETLIDWKVTTTELGVAIGTALVGGLATGWAATKVKFGEITNGFVKFFQNLWNTAFEFDSRVNDLIVNSISNILSSVKSFFSEKMATTLSGLNVIKGFWEEHKVSILVIVGLLVAGVILAITGMVTAVPAAIGSMAGLALALFTGMKFSFAETGEDIKNNTINVFDSLKNGLVDKWKEILFDATKFWTDIANSIKGKINGILDNINFMIRGWNRIEMNVPKMRIPFTNQEVGGQSISLPKIPSIPKLATGGIVKAPTLAMIGENFNEEAVVPLKNSDFIDDFAKRIVKELPQNNDSSGPTEVVLKIDEYEFGRIVINAIKGQQRISGEPIIIM